MQVLPDFTLSVRIAQQIRRMVGGDEFGALEIEPSSAEARNALCGLQQSLRGATAEATDDFRADHGELAEQIRRAGGNLVFFREAIFGWAAFDDVTDVNILAAEAHGLDHLREQLPGSADERFALLVFIAPRTFTDKHELGFWVSHAVDNVRPSFVQLAARAIRADVFANALERVPFDAFIEERRPGQDW